MSSTFLHWLFWTAVAFVVVGQAAILYSTFISIPAARAAGEAPESKATGPQRALEALWAWLPAVGLVFVLFLTWRAVQSPAGVTWRLVVPEAEAAPTALPRASMDTFAPTSDSAALLARAAEGGA